MTASWTTAAIPYVSQFGQKRSLSTLHWMSGKGWKQTEQLRGKQDPTDSNAAKVLA
jgi:hypothetical protein